MYALIFEKRALDFLNKLDNNLKQRIWNKLKECKEDPFRFAEHLTEINGFKLRIGDYRVIFDVDESARVINIFKIGHRKNIYDR